MWLKVMSMSLVRFLVVAFKSAHLEQQISRPHASAKQPGVGFILRLDSNEYFHFKLLFLMPVPVRRGSICSKVSLKSALRFLSV